MSKSTQPKTWVRVVNGLAALAFAAFVLTNYWHVVKTFDLSRAELSYEGKWIGGHAKQITAVTPGGAADRAGLREGDVLQFNADRDSDWVLAGYRHMPQGFSATLPVRHADGSRELLTLVPERVAFLPTLNDRLALLARLVGLTAMILISAVLVWLRPGLMTWALLLSAAAAAPIRYWVVYRRAFEATGAEFGLLARLPQFTFLLVGAALLFAMCFPRGTVKSLSWPKRALGFAMSAALPLYFWLTGMPGPFWRDGLSPAQTAVMTAVFTLITLVGIAAFALTYRHSDGGDRARIKWAMLGISAAWVGFLVGMLFVVGRAVFRGEPVATTDTPANWLYAVCQGVIYPVSLGYAVLRERVIDVQFAVSRTVVYGVVSTIVLVFLAVLHWLLGRMIEHSGFAFGVEGLAAVGLGFVLHRASHGINTTVDRVLFRKHHAAEERLRQVTAALPFASTEQSIAQAIVVEPTRNLDLASAALFYRESAEGPLRRVLAVGWGESHTASLDAESLLVRYLQAEHSALRLGEDQEWLPVGMPEGAAHPVLAIPIVNQHVLTAVVLYGAHVNSTLPDPDEVVLLEALAMAAAASHQQVRIAMLMREKAAAEREKELLARENAVEKERNRQLSAMVQARMAGPHKGTA